MVNVQATGDFRELCQFGPAIRTDQPDGRLIKSLFCNRERRKLPSFIRTDSQKVCVCIVAPVRIGVGKGWTYNKGRCRQTDLALVRGPPTNLAPCGIHNGDLPEYTKCDSHQQTACLVQPIVHGADGIPPKCGGKNSGYPYNGKFNDEPYLSETAAEAPGTRGDGQEINADGRNETWVVRASGKGNLKERVSSAVWSQFSNLK